MCYEKQFCCVRIERLDMASLRQDSYRKHKTYQEAEAGDGGEGGSNGGGGERKRAKMSDEHD